MKRREIIPRELLEQNKDHEGFRENVYMCPAGHATIGYGFNLDAGISEDLAELILEYQLTKLYSRFFGHRWFYELDEVRRCVVVEMAFNIGWHGFHKFTKTIAAIKDCDYELAAKEMLDSKWARQVGKRAKTLSRQMETGNWN